MIQLTKFGKLLVALITMTMIVWATLTILLSRDTHHGEAIASTTTDTAVSSPLLKQTAGDIVMGDENAPVTIIEYASLSCTHCAHFHNEILPELKKRYIDTGKVKFINRPFPLNAPALKGAMLAGCAGKERYYAFIKVMFQEQPNWAFSPEQEGGLDQIARNGGMSDDQFVRCMKDKRLEDNIIAVRKQAEEKLHVESTPTFFVNGTMIAGAQPIEEFAKIIDPLLK